MTSTTNAIQTLKDAGFVFPHELGLFRHPMLTEDGSTIDPREQGFNLIGTGGGCEALEITVGDFVLMLTGEDGCSVPAESEWAQAFIGVYQAAGDEEIAMLTGVQWLEVVSAMTNAVPTDHDLDTKTLAELSAWYVDRVGYDPLKDDPTTDPDTFRADCKEYALIERCGGLDSDAYRIIEASREAEE